MFRISPGTTAAILAAIASPGIAAAQSADELPPELVACAAETDVELRLACFDREMAKFGGKPGDLPAAPAPAATPVEASMPAEQAAPSAAPEPVPVESTTPSPPAAPGAGDDFGLPEQGPDTISATVTDIARRPYGEMIIRLDNGQIWEQKHRDMRFRLEVGEDVTIARGLISGYRLSGGDRNLSIQVERLK